MVTLIDIQLLQLNKLSSKLSSNLTLVAAACSLKHKLNNKLLLVLEATLTTEELQLQLNSSNNNNNKQQQDSQRFPAIAMTNILQKFLAPAAAETLLQKFLAIVLIWLK